MQPPDEKCNPQSHGGITASPIEHPDIYFLEQEWRSHWISTGKPVLQCPDSAFVGFCKHRHLKSPSIELSYSYSPITL